MEQRKIIQQFTVLSSSRVDELEAVLHVMEHKKSGARLVWLDRREENKTFFIAFQTQPWDDTGVFHILEHAVLCGSDRYPVKEPFVELMKSSMNTFLNAITFPDRTVYPVSSRSGQDLINLMRVYMDAVFHPRICARPEIFAQEGWHYELSGDSELTCKGVVFNEMKGALSSPDELLECELNRRLFPDTCYRFVSGGDPEHIPELTYERFLEAHRRLYHPSNAYIFLDGDVDIEEMLGILDREYLSAYDRADPPQPIPLQRPVDGGTAEICYELSSQEELAGRARLVDGFVAGTFRDREESAALEALADTLCGDNQAPLKRRLLESGLARDVRLEVHTGTQQLWVSLQLQDIREEQAEQAAQAAYGELERLAREGLDHRRILATLDNLEFQARQRDYGRTPQGLVFGFQVLESWLYGGDPAANLSVGGLYDELRRRCGEGYFEDLLERVLLRSSHRCRVIMRPSHTAGQERQDREAERLGAVLAGWSGEERTAVRRRQEEIEAWQAAPDTPEALSSIPMLRLDQIPQEPEELPTEETEAQGLPVLRHQLSTGGITYLNLYFALDDLEAEQLSQASFLAQLLGNVDTRERGLEDLRREIRSLFGQMQFTVEAYGRQDDPSRCRSFLCASCSVLDSKLEQASALLAELMTGSRLDDGRRVYPFLCQRRSALAEMAVMAGQNFAMGRVFARSAVEGVVHEYTGGITFLRWLADLERDFDSRFPGLARDMAALAETVFSRRRLTVSITGTRPDAAQVVCGALAESLPEGTFTPPEAPAVQPWGPGREGIVIPAGISFAAMGGPLPAASRGGTKVMGRALSLACLWNTVRVQGGAYGAGMVLWDTGFGGFYSYRDPNALRTLDCYRRTGDFLRSMGDEPIDGLIIGAVAESDPLLTPRLRGRTADARYWRQVSRADLCRVRREMLSAAPEDLRGMADCVERLAAEGSVCILGAQSQIDACAAQLDSVSAL